MKIKQVAKIKGGQDGAVFGKYLFRFDHKGGCRVYDFEKIANSSEGDEVNEIASFTLDRADEICPHSNAVMFGNEYFAEGDEFPLLYSNIYNNYAKTDKPLKGVCCVYRLQKDGERFRTTLVQLIEIGFTEDASLWKLSSEADGVRPYGNFAIDTEAGIYYGFVMRDDALGTRYFAFSLPRLSDGVIDETYSVKKVVLTPSDIKKYFDCDAHHYIQGACCHDGKIYSVEGFKNTPALRVIDPKKGVRELFVNFGELGIVEEAEFIDFFGGKCYYGDCRGNLYVLDF